jgi:multidrug efflux system membrane fusion protein
LATSQPSRRRGWRIFLAIAAILAGSYAGWRFYAPNKGADAATDSRTGAERQAEGQAPIPVTVAPVQKADFRVYLNGLGTVQPYITVTVRSRVDGEIIEVAFKQGQTVKQGDTLVRIDPRPYQAALDQAMAKKAQDEATLKDAQLNLKRYADLAKQDFASKQQLDTQQATVEQLNAQIKGDQAMVDNAQTQLGYTVIKAPLSGKTGFRLVDKGNIVHASDQNGIVTIVKLQPISVVFTAPEEDVVEINKALEAGTVPVSALSTDGLRTLSRGRLALVNNQVDQASGTIGMKATFDNRDNVLWPGLSVSTRLLVETLKQVVLIPEAAVERGPDGLYAFVLGEGNKIEVRPIKVSQSGDGQAVVDEGLTPGQKVVVAGQYRLTAGSVVKPSEKAAPAAPAKEADAAPATAP